MNADDENMNNKLEAARDEILQEKSLVQIVAEDENLSVLIENAFNRCLGMDWHKFDDALESHLAKLAKARVEADRSDD